MNDISEIVDGLIQAADDRLRAGQETAVRSDYEAIARRLTRSATRAVRSRLVEALGELHGQEGGESWKPALEAVLD